MSTISNVLALNSFRGKFFGISQKNIIWKSTFSDEYLNKLDMNEKYAVYQMMGL